MVNRVELIQDSCGAGEHRGGLGVNLEIEMLEDTFATTVCERTELSPWGLKQGREGLANNCFLVNDEGDKKSIPKATRVLIKKGSRVLIQNGGGGGYGSPSQRKKEKVLDDFKQEYISRDYVKKHYPEVVLND